MVLQRAKRRRTQKRPPANRVLLYVFRQYRGRCELDADRCRVRHRRDNVAKRRQSAPRRSLEPVSSTAPNRATVALWAIGSHVRRMLCGAAS